MSKGDAPSELLLMGRIGAAHGIKGEVRITTFTGDPLAIADYGPLATKRPGVTLTITRARVQKNVIIATLKGISDRTEAEKLNGVELFLPRAALPPSDDPEDFYHADLIGLAARLADGTAIGKVLAVPNFGAGDLLEVGDARTGESEFYPFTLACVPEVHVREGYVVIVPPELIEAGPDGSDDRSDGAS